MKTIRLILVCDDDEEDQVLVKEAFSEAYPGIQFRFANDGIELIDTSKTTPAPMLSCWTLTCHDWVEYRP